MSIENKGVYTDELRQPGAISTNLNGENIVTYAAEDAFNFGKAVMKGTTSEQVKKFAGASGVFKGIGRGHVAQLHDR